MTGVALLTFLPVYDITKWYTIGIGKYCDYQRNNTNLRCENCVWNKRFKTHTISYKGGRELQIEMLENITVLTENQCRHKKFLVYKCDSSVQCGGWADRQKGIVSTFLMALLANRKFVIDMKNPCGLEEFLLPNVYNWSLCKSYLKSLRKQNISSFNYIERHKFIREIKQFDFERNWVTDVVNVRFNSYAMDGLRQHKNSKSRLKWLLDMNNEETIHIVLNTLFKPNDRLLNDVIDFHDRQVKGKSLICSHIRKGKNPSIPKDSNLRFGPPNETVIFNYLKDYDNNPKYVIYVAADSSEVKESARGNLTSYININRTIVHVDRLGEFKKFKTEACEGFYSAIMEQLILSLCDKLILTRSGFGTIAAYIRGVSDNLFMYHPHRKRITQTNLTNIQTVFKFL